MKRSQVYFVLGVWGLLGLGFLITHSFQPEEGFLATSEITAELPPLVVPRGETELSGVVRRADGQPAADCEVCLFREELEPGTAEPLHWTFTDEEGRFSFLDLGRGRFRVALLTPASPPTTLFVEPPVEGGVNWTLQEPIPRLGILPELERTNIAGRIQLPDGLDPANHPVANYEVCLVPTAETPPLSGAVLRRARTDGLGNFHFPLVALGNYELEVLPPWARGGTWPVLATREIAAGKDKNLGSALEIPLATGVLRGIVSSIEDHAIEGALVKISPLDAPANRFWPPESTDRRGLFVVGDLPPERYHIRIRAGAVSFETEATVRQGEVRDVFIEPLDTRRQD
ncbi:MAG: hypothetical protein CMJ89_09395 [Planctomycetes bacterium]|nr:hypothetical protein [Planctomycetota bacterium]